MEPLPDAALRGAVASRAEILGWLREADPVRLEGLWRRADAVRRARVGDAVHRRGLVELSNHCARQCLYCGIRAGRRGLVRYRMGDDETLECARTAARLGYGTLVLQAGEDEGLTKARVAGLVRRIKAETGLAVTLSLGERSDDETAAWREAGADRYLLRFESSDRALYERIHPPRPGRVSDRPAQLLRLRAQGYEIGGGMMAGLPGQTLDTLADDLALCRALDLDMVGIGPYLPDPDTPLGSSVLARAAGFGTEAEDEKATAAWGMSTAAWRALSAPAPEDQAPADEPTTLKAVALARLLCPEANIPSTTALGVIDRAHGRTNGLARGANIVMPNLTPPRYRALYAIYPAKAGRHETAEAAEEGLAAMLRAMGRTPGRGAGGRRRNRAP